MNLMVAVDRNWGIGRQQALLFPLPDDLANLKRVTMGKKIIMGRKTVETFPKQKPLPGRENILLTRDTSFTAEGFTVLHSLQELAEYLQGDEDAFVLGGAEIYEQLLPYCHTAYITRVDADGMADRFFPNLDENSNWELQSVSEPMINNEIPFVYTVYSNKAPERL